MLRLPIEAATASVTMLTTHKEGSRQPWLGYLRGLLYPGFLRGLA